MPQGQTRFIVATDWSAPAHVIAALRAFALLGRRGGVTLVIAVPSEPVPEDEARVRRILAALPVAVTGDLSVESFAEVLRSPHEAAIVPHGDPTSLTVQVADWVSALSIAAMGRAGSNSGSDDALRQMITNFREAEESQTPPNAVGPAWYGTYVGGGRILAALRTGGRAYLPADNRATTPNVLQSGVFEPELHAYIAGNVPRGGCVVDVGANIGLVTIALAHAVGLGGRVFAFEPVPANIEFVRWNIETNWLMDIVRLEEAAASSANGTTTMAISEEWNSLGSITQQEIHIAPGHSAQGQRAIEVSTVRLDSYLPSDVNLDLVKIDVEGAEHLVFEGMTGLFTSSRVERVAFECMREHMGDAWPEFMNVLRAHETDGWTFAVPRADSTVTPLPVSALDASGSFRCVVMERPGLRAPVTAHRI